MNSDERGGGNIQPPNGAAGATPNGRHLPDCVYPAITDSSREALNERRRRLREAGYAIDQISGSGTEIEPTELAGSIEGFIGFAKVPLGVAGPIRIQGSAAQGDFFVPFATSEGTLVASFQHAFNAMNRCGGAAALCSDEQVGRAPCFEFANLTEAGEFATWLALTSAGPAGDDRGNLALLRLRSIHASVVGNTVYTLFEFSTGDAAGQNMVTLSTQAICERLLAEMPKKPRSWLMESMLSGDKRATPVAFRSTRGRNVSAEVLLPPRQIERYWRSDAARMEKALRQAVNGAAQTGAVGLQG